jgi:two-component system nitrogen regulation sensor histidine kinase NtrY
MRLRGVLQSLQSTAERILLGRPRDPMSAASSNAEGPRRPGPAALPETVRSRSRLPFTLGLITVVLSLCSGLATYLILTGLTPIVPTHLVVIGVLLINLMLVLAMVVIIAWQVTGLWLARRRQVAGAQLHVRIVSLFSVIAVVPAIMLAVFASVSLNRGLDHWFSGRTKAIIQNSIDVATAYLQEHGQVIRADTVAMARDIDEAVELVKTQPQGFGNFLSAQASMRGLPMAYLIDGQGKLLATAAAMAEFPYKAPPQEAMQLAKKGQVIVIAPGQSSMVGAIKSLQNFDDTYLYVVRPVNARVLQQLRATRANVAEYQLLEQRRTGVQVAFGLMYVAIALTLLLSAIWIGMWFANRLVAPIRQLMGAAQEISGGNLAVNVDVNPADGDLAVLGSTFNTMTSELRSQRDELVGANTKLDERRRFMEAVLSGVTAGVVGVDADGTVTLVNRSAETLLEMKEADLSGKPLAKTVPEFGAVLKRAQKQGKRLVTDQITLRLRGSERNFAVRVTSEGAGQDAQGFVVTFDDMTELVSAQRSTAWADVARRIAHEIKNPLTPIQLSAERIRRKFGKTITEEKDKSIFDQCTDTIVRQVDDIRRMVDEFSRFARMPKPVMEGEDVVDTVRQAVFLMKVAHPELDIETEFREEPLRAQFDRRLISQAVTNILKNATEAIEQVQKEELGKGRIDVVVSREGEDVLIDVIDNGIGLPKVARSRLLEPYVTTRAKGTGLGLAIVGRVLEDHGGRIELKDASDFREGQRGAWMRMRFAITGRAKDTIEVSDRAAAAQEQETMQPVAETKEPAETTNDSAKIQSSKIQASTGT